MKNRTNQILLAIAIVTAALYAFFLAGLAGDHPVLARYLLPLYFLGGLCGFGFSRDSLLLPPAPDLPDGKAAYGVSHSRLSADRLCSLFYRQFRKRFYGWQLGHYRLGHFIVPVHRPAAGYTLAWVVYGICLTFGGSR